MPSPPRRYPAWLSPTRWRSDLRTDVEDHSPTFTFARRWLEGHRPPLRTPAAVVHGDFRLGNLVVGEDGLRAVLDWELVHIGDPLEDLAWLCVKAWRFGARPEAAGVGSVDELLSGYEEAGGRPVDRAAFGWWLVHKTLQWGAICMRQAAVHLGGADRSVELAAIGRRVAEQEWDLLELLTPSGSRPPPGPAGLEAAAPAGLYGPPSATELLEAVEEFLTGPVAAATDGQVRFHARVAANALRIVQRELAGAGAAEARFAAGLRHLGAASGGDLCEQILSGRLDGRDEDLFAFLWSSVGDRLAVANPRHLPKG